MFAVRTAIAPDAAGIAAVHRDAFGDEHPIPELVEAILEHGRTRPEWSVVAEADGGVVGHILVSHCDRVDESGKAQPVAVLSPLGVLPPYQRQGIGSALVEEIVQRTRAAGEPMLIVEGDPRYYGRFGFEAAHLHGIERPRPEIPIDAFQVLRFAGFPAGLRCRVVYSPPFDPL